MQDWRDLIPTIRPRTLVVAGDSVNVPLRSQRWVHEQIAGSELAVVRGREGGTHFPFLESPEEFNRRVSGFLAAQAPRARRYSSGVFFACLACVGVPGAFLTTLLAPFRPLGEVGCPCANAQAEDRALSKVRH